MIITIDGPAGSGKSTAARKLAARLGIAYLDTGAMYRAVALAALQQNAPLHDAQALVRLAETADITVDCGPTYTRVMLNGADVSEAIRSMAVNQATGFVARVPAIRRILVGKQQAIGRRLGACVTEGRDQGSVVFPNADIKFFLDASLDRRAERRYQEMLADGEEVTLEQIRQNLAERDGNDCCQWAPLLEPETAVHVDTTHMSIREVVDKLLVEIEARVAKK